MIIDGNDITSLVSAVSFRLGVDDVARVGLQLVPNCVDVTGMADVARKLQLPDALERAQRLANGIRSSATCEATRIDADAIVQALNELAAPLDPKPDIDK